MINGHPVIYSLGAGRDDDHARPAAGVDDPGRVVANWTTTDPIDGDWILYDVRPAPTGP